jgi:hypothetical protein
MKERLGMSDLKKGAEEAVGKYKPCKPSHGK